MSIIAAGSSIDTLAELVERLGGVPLERIRFRPYPGTATEEDVIRIERRKTGCANSWKACWWRNPWDSAE